ncbi:MAG: helix-turn-helix domain-containing protein [Alphaproteobacteria bacterium]|jgi:DNA-binding phage protein|nr:helix-turn-helix domain-containing protein [Alphaproteobacteria bacterium]
METFGERIDYLVRKLGGKTKAAKELNISTEQIRRWIKEVSDPAFSKMHLLCKLTNSSLDWLAGDTKERAPK